MESQDSATGAINCSGSLSLDLPPGVAVVGGRRTLTSDVDYTVQPAADGSGDVVLLRNADAIVAPLATLARVAEPQQSPIDGTDENSGAGTARSECRRAPNPRQLRACARLQLIRGTRQASIAPTHGRRARSRSAPTAGLPRSTSTWRRNIGRALAAAVARAAGSAAKHSRPLPRLSRPLPEPPVHRRCLRRADARDPRHHGRPLAAAR